MVQKHVNLVEIVKRFPTNIFLQNLASIQKRTRPIKFAHLAEKSEKGSISNLSTKVRELSSWIRHAPGELRRSLLSREDRPEEIAKWEQEAFWSPEKRAQAEAAAEEAARRTTFAAVDELRPSLSENIT